MVDEQRLEVDRLPAPSDPPIVRRMTPADRDSVGRIDRDAFDMYRRRQRQHLLRLTLRTTENLEAAIHRPYPGVVIEWPAGKVVAYCFTHVWGHLGWLGTLGVAPPLQGLGLGRMVISSGLDMLRAAGCQMLALETMPESGKNLGLYTRLGLDPRGMTLLCQGVPEPAPSTHFERPAEPGDALRAVAARLLPGLDPEPAAQWLQAEEAGETLVWYENGEPAAFAVVRGSARRQEQAQGVLTIEVAACVPEAVPRWPQYLSELQTYARSLQKNGMVMAVNAQQIVLLRLMLEARMRIVHTRVRMVIGPPLGAPEDFLVMTLAM